MVSDEHELKPEPIVDPPSVKIAGALVFSVFALFVILCAVVASLVGFRDPDICWLLAMGKNIVSHNALPSVDPFSSNLSTYAIVGPNLPLMQYQWTAEVLFYQTFHTFGANALLILTGFVACTALIAMPVGFFNRGHVPKILALTLAICSFGASYLRIMTRPEIFSTLFMAILISVNLHYSSKTSKQRWLTLFISFVVMALWSNTHMLFPTGIAFLALSALICAIEAFVKTGKLPPYFKIQAGTFLAGLVGSCINPWGYRIWIYIYRLAISPVSYDNIDHQAPDITSPAALFLISLAILYYSYFAYSFKRKLAKISDVVPLAYLFIATILGIKVAKLVPMVTLFAAAGISELCLRRTSTREAANASPSTLLTRPDLFNLLDQVNRYLDEFFQPIPMHGMTLVMVLILVGGFMSTSVRQAQIPENTAVLKPPFKAIEFLKSHPQKGRMLNEGLYGSCMTWYIYEPLDIFMDSRFSMFEPDLVAQYKEMMLCQKNWREMLDQFHISYVFAPLTMPITKALSADKEHWSEIYRDDLASILVRRQQ